MQISYYVTGGIHDESAVLCGHCSQAVDCCDAVVHRHHDVE